MMGATAADAMPLTWPFLQPMFDEVERSGFAFSMPEFEMTVEKSGGFIEEYVKVMHLMSQRCY